MPSLLLLLGNRYVQLGLLAAVLSGGFFVFLAKHDAKIRAETRQSEGQHANDQVTQAKQADESQTTKVLNQISVHLESSDRNLANLALAVASIQARQQQAHDQVAGMTAEQLDQVLAKYSKRDLADCVEQLPLCREENQQKQAAIDELKSQKQDYQDYITTLAGFTGRLNAAYTELYNNSSQPKRGAKCLWLAKCVRPQLKQPDPGKFEIPKPPAAKQKIALSLAVDNPMPPESNP